MNSYKLMNGIGGQFVLLNGVSAIPADPANTDYAVYLAWLAEGNTPEPADPVPNPRIAEIKAALAANDARIIRALAEADAARIAAHNAAQEALRAELRGL